ncbi:MAG: hypothetical protein QOE90_2529 [Thermoplasmata archaeon]|nr:hypothetical protein [Thermoplasmata archaeon]
MRPRDLAALAFVLASFAANSLVTRHVVGSGLLDPGLLTCVRFVAGAAMLAILALATGRAGMLRVGRANVLPALALGAYAFAISYGYAFIPAAAGTFVFYAAVFLTLVASQRRAPTGRQAAGAALALAGLAVLAASSLAGVTALGVALLAATGIAWGLYTAAGRSRPDAQAFTTGNFALLALPLLVAGGAFVARGAVVTPAGLAWGIAMGAGTTALAYVAWYALQRHLGGAQAGLVQLAIPILTSLGAVLALGEAFPPRLALAALLVIAGLALGVGNGATRKVEPPAAPRRGA